MNLEAAVAMFRSKFAKGASMKDAFNAAADAYVDANPTRSHDARWELVSTLGRTVGYTPWVRII
jgi:hypothetical protein